jgi:FkbM family methyltransferase
MAGALNLLPRYVKNMGALRGLLTFTKVEVLGLSRFSFANYRNEIVLRPETTDRKVFREIFLFETYSKTFDFSPRVIIDAGANIGLSSVYFNHRFPDALIIAVEPEPSNYAALLENTREIKNITCINSGLWNTDTFLRIRNLSEAKWAFSVQEVGEMDEGALRAVSIKTLMEMHSVNVIDILKIDIEGSELELFSVNYDWWLSRTRLLIIELHDWMKPGCSSAVFKAVSKFNIETTMFEGMLYIKNRDL